MINITFILNKEKKDNEFRNKCREQDSSLIRLQHEWIQIIILNNIQ
jgi:hypothetical protein